MDPDQLASSADLDLHCFNCFNICFHTVFIEFMHGISKVRAKLGSLCIICSLGQVRFSLDKYLMVIYLSLGSYKKILFSTSLV